MAGLWQPRVVSFSSGGVRVLGHVGVLSALADEGLLTGVREWWGCSGGALCALLGVLGASAGWMRDCVAALDLRILGEVEADMVADFFRTWGVNSGQAWSDYLGRILDTWEPGVSSWTFRKLVEERPTARLFITATNLTQARLAVFSAETTPDVLLLDALRASCAVPLFYAPWISASGEVFCDGAVVEQYPWAAISDKEGALVVVCSETALGRTRVGPMIELSEFMSRVYQTARRGTRLAGIIDTEGGPRNWIAVNNQTVGVLDFGLSTDERLALFEEGARAGRGWLAFRRSRHRSEPVGESQCRPLDSAVPDRNVSVLCGENRMSDSQQLHREEDGPYPSHRLDTERRPGARRWSL